MITAENLEQAIPIECNAGDAQVRANVEASSKRDLPWLDLAEPHDGFAVIVGGGPSMRPIRRLIAALQQRGGTVFAVNGVLPTLYEAGIEADHHVLLDARPGNLTFLQGPKPKHYLMSSQCHPTLFDAISGHPATLWHVAYPEISKWIGEREAVLIGGGTTVGLQTMSIAYAMGFRTLHLFGFDSCYSEAGKGHAYDQPLNDDEPRAEYCIGDSKFICAPWMVRQAIEFQTTARQLLDDNVQIYAHGSGVIPTIAARLGQRLN